MIPGMQRRALPWLLALPLLAAGSLTAHSLAYRIVQPGAEPRRELLNGTGHGYLGALPFLAGGLIALLVAATVCYALRATRGRPVRTPSWPLILLPPLGFAIQEHAERFVAGAGDVPATALEPTFLVGMALQLPFALVAFLAARRLARAATELGKALSAPPQPTPRRRERSRQPVDVALARRAALALGYAERGPPG
jgi:hypothetical protein